MKNTAINKIKDFLPRTVQLSLDRIPEETLYRIAEIRLRAGNISTITLGGENLYLCDTGISRNSARCVRTTCEDIEAFIYKLCGGSVYSYENTVKNGFITRFGARTGLCGEAIVKGREMCGFTRITGVNIRIPNHIQGCCEDLLLHISENGFSDNAGILVVSPPGVGKTTVLRELAIRLSRGIWNARSSSQQLFRVTVIDERNEIYIPELFYGCAADIMSGVPKDTGLECAARVMSPEIIICDEIGSKADAEAISAAHIGGVVFIASMHGSSVESVIAKDHIKKLCSDGVFSHIYLLLSENGKVNGRLWCIKEHLSL